METRRYGWKPDVPDQRDHLYGAGVAAPVALPSHVDLRPGCTPVKDQGSLGSCTSQAIAGGALEFLEKKDGLPPTALSRLFLYYNERAMEGTIKSDAGAHIRDGIKSCATLGVCPEVDWAYNTSQFKIKPPVKAYKDALQHVVTSYQRILGIQQMKQCLAAGYPFVCGISVYESFESAAVAQTGIVPMPGPTERCLGGHAILGVGFDDSVNRFIMRNSWGAGWGSGGYFFLPYNYLANITLADDFWTVRAGKGL